MSDDVVGLLPIVVLVVFGYLLFIRPTRKRAQEVTALQNALSTDDEVMMTSGIFGRVDRVVDEHVFVEVADGVILKVHRGAIAKIVRDVPAYDEPESPTTELPDEPREAN